jgi:flagellar hook protein FlgE
MNIMSLLGNLGTAVNGLNVQSKKMRSISNNIANAETNGYKAQNTAFGSLVLSDGNGRSTTRSVVTSFNSNIGRQGEIRSTDNIGDLAINGSGFFLVRKGTGVENPLGMMRTGSFHSDKDGYLVDEMGYTLQGTAISMGKDTPALTLANTTPVQIPSELEVVDGKITYTGALDAVAADADPIEVITKIKSPLGKDCELTLTFTNSGEGTWDVAGSVAGLPGEVELEEAVFLENGDWSGLTNGAVTATITWRDKSLPTTKLTLDLNGISGDAKDSTISVAARGVSGWNITEEGIVEASLSDGSTQQLYQLPLAKCSCPDKLSEKSGGTYFTNNDSGPLQLSRPEENGLGSLYSGTLESSTVDIAQELSDMITTQYAYSANTKVISTISQMLDALMRL